MSSAPYKLHETKNDDDDNKEKWDGERENNILLIVKHKTSSKFECFLSI